MQGSQEAGDRAGLTHRDNSGVGAYSYTPLPMVVQKEICVSPEMTVLHSFENRYSSPQGFVKR